MTRALDLDGTAGTTATPSERQSDSGHIDRDSLDAIEKAIRHRVRLVNEPSGQLYMPMLLAEIEELRSRWREIWTGAH